MPLPILSNPVESDLIRLFHRMTLHFTQHLGETTQLDVGTAIETTVEFIPAASSGSLIEVQGLEAEFNVWSHTTIFEEIAGLESSEAAQLLELLENQNGASPVQ